MKNNPPADKPVLGETTKITNVFTDRALWGFVSLTSFPATGTFQWGFSCAYATLRVVCVCVCVRPDAWRWRRAWISTLGRFNSRCLQANDTFLVRDRFDVLSDSLRVYSSAIPPPRSLPRHSMVAGFLCGQRGYAIPGHIHLVHSLAELWGKNRTEPEAEINSTEPCRARFLLELELELHYVPAHQFRKECYNNKK